MQRPCSICSASSVECIGGAFGTACKLTDEELWRGGATGAPPGVDNGPRVPKEWSTGSGSVWIGVRSTEGAEAGAPKADVVVHGNVHVGGRSALKEKVDGGIPDCPLMLGSNFGKAGALTAAPNGVPNDGKPVAQDDESTEVPLDDAPPMPEKTGFGPCELDENGSSTQVDVECSTSSGEFTWNALGTTCKLTDKGF